MSLASASAEAAHGDPFRWPFQISTWAGLDAELVLFAALGSGTLVNQIFGPPQPAASTNALSAVESSSASEPKTAAQNLASASASAASKETGLITLTMPVT
jgi:hypothetical protein